MRETGCTIIRKGYLAEKMKEWLNIRLRMEAMKRKLIILPGTNMMRKETRRNLRMFHLDGGLSAAIIQLTGQLTGADTAASSIQMTVVDAIKNPAFFDAFLGLQGQFPNVVLSILLPQIQQTNMSLFGTSLGAVPSMAGGLILLMPLAAGVAAWLLCVAQNKLNPVQAEQGNFKQNGMTAVARRHLAGVRHVCPAGSRFLLDMEQSFHDSAAGIFELGY